LTAYLTDSGTLAASVIGQVTEYGPDGPWLDFNA